MHPKGRIGRALIYPAIFEMLERRCLLSGGTPDVDFWNRIRTGTATPADFDEYEQALVDFGGGNVYAKAGEWIAKFNLDHNRPTVEAAVDELGLGAEVKRVLGNREVALIEFPGGTPHQELRSRFDELELGPYIEPNVIIAPAALPNDDLYGEQYALAKISAPDAWDATTGSKSVVMAFFDSGVDAGHEDLTGNVWTNPGEIPGNNQDDDGNGYIDDYYGFNFANLNGDVSDNSADGHGTHVAGTMGAVGNNTIGVAGVNWTAQVMAIKVFGGSPFASRVIEGLNYVAMMKTRGVNVRVTNHSWEYPFPFTPPQSLRDAIQYQQEQNILFVAAAGNRGANNDMSPTYPASYDLDIIISVANTDANDNLYSSSSYGTVSVDLGAPGTAILNTVPLHLDPDPPGMPDGYTELTGTSMAAPHVAGVAGLAFSLVPFANYQVVKSAILNGVDPVPALDGLVATGGRLNAFSTLNLITPQPVIINGDLLGSGPNDTIIVRSYAPNPTQLEVMINGIQAFLGPKAYVSSLTINGLDGNDSITLQDQFDFPITINGGEGDDTITVLSGVAGGEVEVAAGNGSDILNVNTDNTGVAVVSLGGPETFSQLNIGTGGGVVVNDAGNLVLRTQSLSIASGGFLDLGSV